ncbi:MAG: hypothetical protein RR449_02305 [Christensenella sp.]
MADKYQIYTNQQTADDIGRLDIKPTQKETERLRKLAARYSEIAQSDDMKTKKRQWTALRDLKPERPMILFETFSVTGFLTEADFECENPYLKNVEKTFLQAIKQYEFVQDDIVIENYFQLAWRVIRSDYGVKIVEHHADDSMGYMSNFPIATPEDMEKLKPRTFYVDRERTLGMKQTLEDIFGDILPVRVGNYDNFFPDFGFNPFCGNNAPVITMDLFKLVGNDNLMFWPYDYPEALTKLMDFLMEDRRRFVKWLQDEKIMALNTDNQFAGPSGYGYVSELPNASSGAVPTPKNCWTWVESQETNLYSPDMFGELFLPYLAEYANMFGLVSYGCCEPVDDRIDLVKKAMPGLRTVSVSGWNNFESVAESLGKDYVYCRKPNPAYISGADRNWDGMKKDIERTWNCTKNQPVEFVVRDVYDIAEDMARIPEWVKMTKETVGI